jgi:hypothetical protein
MAYSPDQPETVPEMDGKQQFRQQVFARAREAWRHSARQSLVNIGMLAAVFVAAIGVSFAVARGQVVQRPGGGDTLSGLSAQLVGTAIRYRYLSAALFAAMILAAIAALYAIYDGITYLVNTRLLVWLFGAPPYQALYRKLTSSGMERQKRAAWWAFAVLGVVALGSVLGLYLTIGEAESGGQEVARMHFESLAGVLAVGGVVAGCVLAIPTLRLYLRDLKADPTMDRSGLQRCFVFQLFRIALVLTVIVLLAQVALPALVGAHTAMYRTLIMPRLKADVLDVRSAMVNLDLEDESRRQVLQRFLESFDAKVTNNLKTYGLVVTERDREWLDLGIPMALNFSVWTLLVGVALFFVLPYLALGGWRRGLFYMVTLLAAFIVEGTLQESAPTWFSLQPRSVGAVLIVAFAVFANALFFEWVFDLLTERRKVCPRCHAHLRTVDAYCSSCGLSQP